MSHTEDVGQRVTTTGFLGGTGEACEVHWGWRVATPLDTPGTIYIRHATGQIFRVTAVEVQDVP